jgi:peptide methionine sulfoxide reductase MsrA
MKDNVCYKYTWDVVREKFSVRKCNAEKIEQMWKIQNGHRHFRRIRDYGVVYNKGIVVLKERDDNKAKELFIENYKKRYYDIDACINKLQNANLNILN